MKTKSAAKHRILIVDDHPLYRDGLRRFIDSQPDLTCCGQADSARSALRTFLTAQPDLVILDLRLRGDDGMGLLQNLLAQKPHLRVLVLSQKDEAVHAEPVLRAGAHGYIMKEEATEDLLTAIREVLQGRVYVGRRLSGLILKKFLCGSSGNEISDRLSDRELQVFQLLGSRLSTQDIADQLHLSVKTVETHRDNIKHKLGFPDAASLLEAAQAWVRTSGDG